MYLNNSTSKLNIVEQPSYYSVLVYLLFYNNIIE